MVVNSLDPDRIASLIEAVADGAYQEIDPATVPEADRRMVQALNRLARRRERNRLIVDATPVGICITDERGRYEHANPRYCELTGYRPEELIGQSFLMVVPARDRGELAGLHDRFMGETRELSGRWRIVARDGREIPILASAAYVIDEDGRPKKITFVVDITELSDAYDRIATEVAERKRLEQMREEVERVLRHDLKNPIDGIRTAADYLMQEDLPERAAEFARLMYDAAVRARTRIDNSLAYTRMQRGEYHIDRERLNGVQVVRAAVTGLQETARAYRTAVTTTYRGGPPPDAFDVEVWGEYSFLVDAITNLTRNAIEASRDGDEVRIDLDDTGTDAAGMPVVRFRVSNPADIPEEIRDSLFEPYVTHGKSGGTGLGTYTARLVVTAHGGDISVRTGGGETIFTVTVPRGRPGDDR